MDRSYIRTETEVLTLEKRKKIAKNDISEPQDRAWFAFLSILAGLFAAYAVTHNWLDSSGTYSHLWVWLAGGFTLGYGLTRIFPNLFGKAFQGIGYVAGFAALMLAVPIIQGKALPTLSGSINTRAISAHVSDSVSEVESLADQAQDGISLVVGKVKATIQP